MFYNVFSGITFNWEATDQLHVFVRESNKSDGEGEFLSFN
jgi:hypothetical protein